MKEEYDTCGLLISINLFGVSSNVSFVVLVFALINFQIVLKDLFSFVVR